MNTYFGLCVALCLGIFSLALFAGLVVAEAVAGLLRLGRRRPHSPFQLFSVRIFPFVFSAAVTLALALPAFLSLEPRQTGEVPELYLIVLTAMSLFLLAKIAVRLLRLLIFTARLSCHWRRSATRANLTASMPVFRITTPANLFAVVGIFRPKVFIGKDAFDCLTREELEAAIAHESAHVRSLDNLKRTLLSITRLPRLFRHLNWLDGAWSEATELAADEEALGGRSAVDLISALIKIGRLQVNRTGTLDGPSVASCHLVISGEYSSIALRLERLRHFVEDPQPLIAPPHRQSWSAIILAFAAVVAYWSALPMTLRATHMLMEVMAK